MNKVAAIVVTYNRVDLLMECIKTLKKLRDECDIIIIDNASTDGTQEKIAKYIDSKTIFYFNTGKNIGGAGGFNYGLRKAYDAGYEYFWMMDDDTIVMQDSLSSLLEFEKNNNQDYGFLSSVALWKDGTECKMNYHMIAKNWQDDKKQLCEGVVRITTATFVSFFLKRCIVEEIGLPIKEYFIWGDDTEYSNRISAKYPCYLVGKSRVIHKMNSNTATNDIRVIKEVDRIERMFFTYRNDCCTYKRQGKKKFLGFTKRTLVTSLLVLFSRNKYKGKKLKIIAKGYYMGLKFNPQIEKIKV